MRNIYVLLFAILIPGFITQSGAQIITTIAGTGTPGYSGDAGLATAAALNYPYYVCADNSGNIYFSEDNNYCIRKITPANIISTIAGSGAPGYSGDGALATAAHINHAGQITVDASGNIYFADSYNNCVRKISSSGIISTIAGNGTAGFTSDGVPATSSELNNPLGVALDVAGNLYIADFYNNRIRKVNTSGIISTIAGTGFGGYSGDGIAASAAALCHPNNLLMDNTGNLFITDNANHRIRKINTSGIISTVAGNGTPGFAGDGSSAISAEIDYPGAIAMDALGDLYICDYLNSRLRMVNTSGVINTIAGTGVPGYSGDGITATSAELNYMTGVALDNSGNILIADYHNNRIRKIGASNHPPFFTGGSSQDLTVCIVEAPTPINSLLSIVDIDPGQTETWSLLTAPIHGSVVAAFTTISTGSTLTPTGLTYTPAVGYTGSDIFTVSITDGIVTTTVTINVQVSAFPNAGIISGVDSVCPGQVVTLSETSPGGIWSNSNTTISNINSLGNATGVAPGSDTVIYTVINACGIASAIFPFNVESYESCHTGLEQTGLAHSGVDVYPNPNNGAFSVKVISDVVEETHIVVSNILGFKTVEITGTTNEQMQININLAPGIYFISAFTSRGISTGKIIITK